MRDSDHTSAHRGSGLSRTVEWLSRALQPLMVRLVPKKYHPHLFRIYLRFVSPFYAGDECSCPCCGGQYRAFVPYKVVGGRVNLVCPGCGSFARHRLLFMYLTNRTNLFSARLRVLHIAPEYWLQRLLRSKPNLEYVSADLDSSLAMEKADITNLQYADNSFDAILCTHVLEHVKEDQKAMRELCRVLKPGGWAILQVPLDKSREISSEDPNIVTPEDRERFYKQADHVRLYGRDFKYRLQQAGFQVKQDAYVEELSNDIIRRHRLDADEDLYYCIRPRSDLSS